jgi:DNA-binding protein HU-beta
MNKSELVAAVAEGAELTKKDAERAVNVALEAVAGSLAKGDDVAIAGFGNFKVNERAARAGRNPQTGAAIQIAASKNVSFKAGKALKESL